MKFIWVFSIIVFFLLQGCTSDDAAPVIKRISTIEAFDVGNVGDATDIVVRFKIENFGGVEEFRIVVIPESDVESFTTRKALNLLPEQYLRVGVSTDETQVVRLTNVLDTEGSPTRNNKNYVIKIMSVGDRLNQISLVESNLINLTLSGIYEGAYIGTVCCWGGGEGGGATVYMTLNGFNNYNGDATINPNNQEFASDVSIEVEGDQVIDFRFVNIEGGPVGSDGSLSQGDFFSKHLVDCDLESNVFGQGLFQDLGFDVTYNNCIDKDIVQEIWTLDNRPVEYEPQLITVSMNRVLALPD